MKILAIGDIDDLRWKGGAGDADAVVSCGDVADEVILEAAEAYGCRAVFAVKGNHDSSAPFPGPVVDLHLRVVEHGAVMLGGFNGSWKYKPRGHFLYEQWEVERMLAAFPRTDVFVSHNSPRGVHDREDDVHLGFDGLRAYVLRERPALLIHGHQHADCESELGGTTVVGVRGWKLLDA